MVSVYFLTLIVAIFLSSIGKRMSDDKNISKHFGQKGKLDVFDCLQIVFLTIIAGFRDTATISLNYGRQSDELNYRNRFYELQQTSFDLNQVDNFEVGRYLIDWTLANLFESSQIWVFFYALLTNYLYVKVIKKYITPNWAGVFLYITLGIYVFQMNGTASVLAGAVLAYSFEYIARKQFLYFLIVVLIASMIHLSSLIVLILYPILVPKESQNIVFKSIVAIASGVIGVFLFVQIANVILPYTPYDFYLSSLQTDDYHGVNILRVVFFVGLYLFIALLSRKIELNDFDKVMLNINFILIVLTIISFDYVYVYRFIMLFSISTIYLLAKLYLIFGRRNNVVLISCILGLVLFLYGLQQTVNVLYENIIFR